MANEMEFGTGFNANYPVDPYISKVDAPAHAELLRAAGDLVGQHDQRIDGIIHDLGGETLLARSFAGLFLALLDRINRLPAEQQPAAVQMMPTTVTRSIEDVLSLLEDQRAEAQR